MKHKPFKLTKYQVQRLKKEMELQKQIIDFWDKGGRLEYTHKHVADILRKHGIDPDKLPIDNTEVNAICPKRFEEDLEK